MQDSEPVEYELHGASMVSGPPKFARGTMGNKLIRSGPAVAGSILILSLGCSASRHDEPRASAADAAAIARLHEQDMRAVMTGDTTTLMSLWTDDIVALPPDGPITVGREANAAVLRQAAALSQAFEPTSYRLEFDSVELLGDHAIEWGWYRGSARPRGGGAELRYRGKVLRVLRREADGSWRVARTMFSQEPSDDSSRGTPK